MQTGETVIFNGMNYVVTKINQQKIELLKIGEGKNDGILGIIIGTTLGFIIGIVATFIFRRISNFTFMYIEQYEKSHSIFIECATAFVYIVFIVWMFGCLDLAFLLYRL